jgi:hypothetical protein
MRTLSPGPRISTAIVLGAAGLLLAVGCQGQNDGGSRVASASPSPSQRTSLADRAQTSEQPTSKPIKSAPAKKPSTPKPSPTGPSLSAAYAGALQIDAQHLVAANGARTTSCAGRDMAACRSALQQVSAAAAALQHDLDANQAPTCMKAADTSLRAAVGLYQQGATLGTQGIDQNSSSKLAQAKTLLDQGTSRLLTASDQMGRAACTVPPPAVAP